MKLLAYRIFDPVKAPPSANNPVDLTQQIATRAYELYQERGSVDGKANQDWLEAERETRKNQAGKKDVA